MSPEERHRFEAIWPDLAVRLDAFLARKQVPTAHREDLVQETGTRLVGMWEEVDQSRDTWPLAMTIALNLIRDRARRGVDRELASEIPDVPSIYNVESAGLARVELSKVRDALPQLTARQRAAVLAEVGNVIGAESSGVDKMTRSRARRKLSLIVGRISAGISLQFRRLSDFVQALSVTNEGALSGLSCTACALLAMSAIVTHPGPALDLGGSAQSDGVTFSFPMSMSETAGGAELALSGTTARAEAAREDASLTGRGRRSISGTAKGARATGSSGGTESSSTLSSSSPGSTELTPPEPPDTPELPSRPGVPGRGGSDDDGGLPGPPTNGLIDDAVEEVGEVVMDPKVLDLP